MSKSPADNDSRQAWRAPRAQMNSKRLATKSCGWNWENGFVLWSRADDLLRERGRQTRGRDGGEAWRIDLRSAIPKRAETRGERGLAGLGIKVLEFIGVDLKGKAASMLGGKLETKLLGGHPPGLYRCSLDDAFSLTAVDEHAVLPADPQPILIFLHGTASSCQAVSASSGMTSPTPPARRRARR